MEATTSEKKPAAKWHDELKRYEENFERFVTRGEKIVKRYRDERKDADNVESRYNILWSNVRTLKPAIYTKAPKPEVSRRFKDDNPVARAASTIIERALSYEITQFQDYHYSVSAAVDDRLLIGRGCAWIRYEPKFETIEGIEIADDDETDGDEYDEDKPVSESSEENGLAGEPLERITSETCPVDYVYWRDFAHLPARTWDEVTWVGRRVYMGRDEGVERFGDVFEQVPLTHSPDEKDNEKETTKDLKKAEVWEIWCKSTRKVYWIAENFESILDERDDPLELENFFPCPRPLFATITTGSLVPVADYILYQDQADELDVLTSRIVHLTKAMKVMGIYAADEAAVGRLLKEGNDGVMIPVTNWAAFIEKGGLQNVMQFVPLGDIATALQELYRSRESCKQIIYDVTGLSDIVRGASVASETATAQSIKSQFASIRLNDMKDDVARFARELLRMKVEVMCSKYQPQTLIDMSGIMYTDDAELAEQAIALLKNEPMRNFTIDIENDTLVQLDEQQEKQNRIEFLTAIGSFLEKSVVAGQQSPELVPLMGEMLMFGIRGFKVGRTIEAAFDNTLKQMQQKQQQASQQPPQPNPEMLKLQADQAKSQQDAQMAQAQMQHEQQMAQSSSQLEQMKMQIDQTKAQSEIQSEQSRMALEHQKLQIEQMKIQSASDIEIQKMNFERWKAELEANTSISVAQINAQNAIDTEGIKASSALAAKSVGQIEGASNG